MRFWQMLLGVERPPVAHDAALTQAPRHRFSGAIGSDYQTWLSLVGNTYTAGKVSREQAMRVPGLKRARDLLCGTLGTLPLHAFREGTGERVDHQLLTQPESLKGLVRSVTMARTIEDLFYDSASLWLVIQRAGNSFPAAIERIDHGSWQQDEAGTIWVRGNEIKDPSDAILFVSPNDPMLLCAAATVRTLLRLEATAELYADQPEAAEYFTPVDGNLEPEDEDVQAFLSDWNTARKTRATGFIPAGIERREIKRMTGAELQLIEAREFSVKEISRLTGIDSDWLSVVSTSRTYQNLQDARRHFVDHTASPFLHAIEERLSLGDVTPRGQRVKFNLDGFLRANTAERYAAHKTGLEAGFLTIDEVRALEDRPPFTPPGNPA